MPDDSEEIEQIDWLKENNVMINEHMLQKNHNPSNDSSKRIPINRPHVNGVIDFASQRSLSVC